MTKATGTKAAHRARGDRALELRQAGGTWAEIATLAGYSGATTAQRGARRAAARARSPYPRQGHPRALHHARTAAALVVLHLTGSLMAAAQAVGVPDRSNLRRAIRELAGSTGLTHLLPPPGSRGGRAPARGPD